MPTNLSKVGDKRSGRWMINILFKIQRDNVMAADPVNGLGVIGKFHACPGHFEKRA